MDDGVRDLAIKQAQLEEKMKTLEANLATKLEELKKDMAQRDIANTRWTIGVVIAAVIVLLAGIRYL